MEVNSMASTIQIRVDDELKIKSISKGEIVIAGNIKNIDMECLCKT